MFKKLAKFFGLRSRDKSLEERLFASVLRAGEPRDYFRWPSTK